MVAIRATRRRDCGRPARSRRRPGRPRGDPVGEPPRVAGGRPRDPVGRRDQRSCVPDERGAAGRPHPRRLRGAVSASSRARTSFGGCWTSANDSSTCVTSWCSTTSSMSRSTIRWCCRSSTCVRSARNRSSPTRTSSTRARRAVRPDDVATLVYTSGTTGPPKGAVLTHANIMATLRSVTRIVPLSADDRFLSFLPLSHITERSVSHFGLIAAGGETWFARSISTVAEDLADCRPTIFFAVPARLGEVPRRRRGARRRAAGSARRPRPAIPVVRARACPRGRGPRPHGISAEGRMAAARRERRRAHCAGSSVSTARASSSRARRRSIPTSCAGSRGSGCRSPRATARPRSRW